MQTHLNSTNVTNTSLVSLFTILEEVPDPRVRATVDHDLPDILTIALCTILCGGDSFYDMGEFGEVRLDWLKTFLRLRNGAPTHDTYNRSVKAKGWLLENRYSSRLTRMLKTAHLNFS